ncbi:hypothetical protein LTS07_001929 [Exophiala sideris]|uniref:AB hydrolase-1 domain-containing protein n=1 Tax=Exophiala sideris TaxID=1016849 RepID=A0ABR0JLN6_9EURO|nr:hypothetical protein LTR13_007423 [Exophiala sideris]KAK5036204.1 hypothetical protein LTS07_001929 [Exophiala sideris]KAK5066587.1 hypothetical protein LTR69_001933 [Exophiala sideris]KAK5180409.1 hypothetical protein LTR44_007166 [Eurotiomycetes sp. CCFEE 6388]
MGLRGMALATVNFALQQAQDHPVFAATICLVLLTTLTGSPGKVFGMAKTRYWHSTKSLILKTKDGQTTSLAQLCKSLMPPCRLNPLLYNGHLQTIWTVLASDTVPIHYKRRIFDNEDPMYTGQFAVDFATDSNDDHDSTLPPRTTYYSEQEFKKIGSLDNRPMLVMLHGLSGGSHELYLRHVLAPLIGKGGWEACVVIARGCARTKITSSVLYNARATWDVKQIVKWLKQTFPNRPLFGIGFSLGANIITNYIAEEGSNCAFKAAVVLSNPWDLHAGNLALQRGWFNRNVYSATMGKSMVKLFNTHVEQVSKNPKIDVDLVRSSKYLHEFDRHVQCPTWGYPTEGAYYRDASSVDSLMAIRVPFLAIHAEDDPVTASEALPRVEVQQTPYGVLCTTSTGGHLGWFELGGTRWCARAATAFFQKMARDIDVDAISRTDGDGFHLEGQISREERQPLKPVFEPMRRKMHIPGQ